MLDANFAIWLINAMRNQFYTQLTSLAEPRLLLPPRRRGSARLAVDVIVLMYMFTIDWCYINV